MGPRHVSGDEPPRKIRGGLVGTAARRHQGPYHWHVDIRSSVIVCRACQAKVPKYLKPRWCPECGSGKPDG